MSKPIIQSFRSLRKEMIAVAKGQRGAPAGAANATVHSAEVLARLLTPQNRELMATIRDSEPRSIAALAKLSQRQAPNVVRTLDKLEALGLIYFVVEGRSKAPRVAASRITIEMDPYSPRDIVTVSPVRAYTAGGAYRRPAAAVAEKAVARAGKVAHGRGAAGGKKSR
jgi:predicted transcriptional regulator